MRSLVLCLASLLVACGGAAIPGPGGADPTATPSETPVATVTPDPTATSAPSAAAGPSATADTFTVDSTRSQVTVRVREQLAALPAPSDAVLQTSKVSGTIAIDSNGTVQPGSVITVDVSSLKSNSDLRDNFVKGNTLQTRQFPTATFTVTRVSGLPRPLPPTGTWELDLVGVLNIRGVAKEVIWKVAAKGTPNELDGTATLTTTFGAFGMQPPRAASVLSVVDSIHLEAHIVAART